jgi:hypothetical protein
MASGFTLEPREGYLYVQLEPGFEMSPENMTRMWSEISERCRGLGVLKVLAVGDNVVRRMTPTQASDFVGHLSRLLPGLTVACCFHGYVPDGQTELVRTAAMSRGMRSEFFQDLAAALQWLGVVRQPKR